MNLLLGVPVNSLGENFGDETLSTQSPGSSRRKLAMTSVPSFEIGYANAFRSAPEDVDVGEYDLNAPRAEIMLTMTRAGSNSDVESLLLTGGDGSTPNGVTVESGITTAGCCISMFELASGVSVSVTGVSFDGVESCATEFSATTEIGSRY
ncbi:MAG: hypothetical protein HC933_00465 [Pleurocapsa sp. SU_196_0]|nr:hypothetical protein [Pleurocapsa sp. SU_196_0]